MSASSSRRVARVESLMVEVPCTYPIRSSIRVADTIVNVVVELESADGLIGTAYVAGFTIAQGRAIQAMVDELKTCVLGLPVSHTGLGWQRMLGACRLGGRAGPGIAAMSAIDTALWDMKARDLGAPLHAVLGTVDERLDVYASDGCWLGTDPESAADQASQLVKQGFRAVKVRFGRERFEDDMAVLDAVLEVIGPAGQVLVDVNQGWRLDVARRCAAALIERGVNWLEEPLDADDHYGLALMQREFPLRLVAGESAYLPRGIEALVSSRAVSIAMPDLQRVGGVTGWIRASSIAETAGLEVTAHLFPEVSVHLLAACPQPGPLEFVSWMQPYVKDPLVVHDGTVEVPDRPGLGMDLMWSKLRGYVVD